MNIQKKLASMTSTDSSDWSVLEGPASGTGVDYWLQGPNGMEAYCNMDQVYWTFTVHDRDGQEVAHWEGYEDS